MKQYCDTVLPVAVPGATTPNLSALSPVLRMLVVTDGTVTELLEAYFLEPIGVRKLGPLRLEERQERVYEREVLLVGESSRRVYVHAHSTILLDRLDAPLREGLLQTDKGIGRLLREAHMETFRELGPYWTEPAGPLAVCIGVLPSATLLGRTYVVFCREQPIMRITERFCCEAFGA